ncbi:hypothetical protein ACX80V_03000 [Arthrobacter sp. MDT3-24]
MRQIVRGRIVERPLQPDPLRHGIYLAQTFKPFARQGVSGQGRTKFPVP